VVGIPGSPHPSPSIAPFVFKRRSLGGSVIGGIAETQEVLDFCAKHGITSDIETIAMQDIEVAFNRMLKSDVKYRFVTTWQPCRLHDVNVRVPLGTARTARPGTVNGRHGSAAGKRWHSIIMRHVMPRE
ncbi:MAG: hydroxyacid dehydrogenase, partial [Jatrophihabitans sp.]|nr:hydroxyacid dehydrogenase [Jatrophihabitans sp.]